MSSEELLLIQPLLGPGDTWAGYLVVGDGTSPVVDEAVRDLCTHPLLDQFDQRHPWLVPAARADSASRARLTGRAIVVFPESGMSDEALCARESALRQVRAKVGLAVTPAGKLPATGSWDYLLISASHARSLPPYALQGMASRTVVVATEVLSHGDYRWLQDNACTLCSAEFLSTRHAPGKKADMTRVKLLELLGLVANDADTAAIEAVFRQEPKLSYSLLRLVNSAATAPRTPITSFAQAINLLGRRQLQRWLQLLVYADPNNGQHPNPLLAKAATRGRLLELLAPTLSPRPEVDVLEDAAFMVGAFSLLDVLLNMSMSDILKHLPLPAAVHDALGEHAGGLGELLRAVHTAESRNVPEVAAVLERIGVSPAAWRDAQLTALSWAARIHPEG